MPVVDASYGGVAIAAANARSDVCAMDVQLVLALNTCAFPSTTASSKYEER